MSKPLIGVMPLWDEGKKSIWMLPGHLEGIREAGGTPVIFPLTEDREELEQLCSLCNGFLITGGQDVDPAIYRETQMCIRDRDKYEHTGWKKFYLIYGMCDESFSINCTVTSPEDVDKGWFMFFVTLLNHLYWVCGATAGALLGYVIHFDTTGIEFVMTALFVIMFMGPVSYTYLTLYEV